MTAAAKPAHMLKMTVVCALNALVLPVLLLQIYNYGGRKSNTPAKIFYSNYVGKCGVQPTQVLEPESACLPVQRRWTL